MVAAHGSLKRCLIGVAVALGLALSSGPLLSAHEVPVHKALTDAAVDFLVLKRPELAACNTDVIRNALKEGVDLEDNEPLPQNNGGPALGRFIFHFLPLLQDTVNGGKAVINSECDSAFWASGAGLCRGFLELNLQGQALAEASGSNIYTKEYARTHLIIDPSAPGPLSKRQGIVAVGHLIHLLQDLTSPAHTRDDAHPHVPFYVPLSDPSTFEVFNEANLAKNGTSILPLPTGNLPSISSIDQVLHALAADTASRFHSEKDLLTFTFDNLPAAGKTADCSINPVGPFCYAYDSDRTPLAHFNRDTQHWEIDPTVALGQFSQLAPQAIRLTAAVLRHVQENIGPLCEQLIQISASGDGKVTSTVDGFRAAGNDAMSCLTSTKSGQSGTCEHYFPSGNQQVLLQAEAPPGARFLQWEGECASFGDSPYCYLIPNGTAPIRAAARFSEIESRANLGSGRFTIVTTGTVVDCRGTSPFTNTQLTDLLGTRAGLAISLIGVINHVDARPRQRAATGEWVASSMSATNPTVLNIVPGVTAVQDYAINVTTDGILTATINTVYSQAPWSSTLSATVNLNTGAYAERVITVTVIQDPTCPGTNSYVQDWTTTIPITLTPG
jgi:hypothetical protein